jgi:antitoxin ParD1/3/4
MLASGDCAMQTMNIALPKTLKDYVQVRAEQGGYSSVSEYIRELIRLDQQRSAQALLEAELLKGLASGPAKRMASAEWAGIRAEVKRRTSRRSK